MFNAYKQMKSIEVLEKHMQGFSFSTSSFVTKRNWIYQVVGSV